MKFCTASNAMLVAVRTALLSLSAVLLVGCGGDGSPFALHSSCPDIPKGQYFMTGCVRGEAAQRATEKAVIGSFTDLGSGLSSAGRDMQPAGAAVRSPNPAIFAPLPRATDTNLSDTIFPRASHPPTDPCAEGTPFERDRCRFMGIRPDGTAR